MNRKLVITAATAWAVVALGACGSSTDAKPAPGGVDGQAVATKMVDAMVASKTAHVTMSREGKPVGAGDLEFTKPGVPMTMKMSLLSQKMEIVQVGGVTYVKGVPGTKKPWVKIDPKATDGFSKIVSSMGDQSTSGDPMAVVTLMKGLTGKDLGTKQVGGVSTRQYSFQIPNSAYGRLLGPQLQKQMETVAQGPITVEYFVGDDNLLRKITTVIGVTGRRLTSEATYSDWGKPVRIVAPPAAEIGPRPGL